MYRVNLNLEKRLTLKACQNFNILSSNQNLKIGF
jgi:hypothetical protein